MILKVAGFLRNRETLAGRVGGVEEALGQGLMHLHPDRPGRRVKLWGFKYKNRNTKAGFHAAPHTQQNGGGEVAKDTNDITRQALAVETRNLNLSGSAAQ